MIVLGAGAVGLLVGAMAKLGGATRIIISDINKGRVDFAIKEGFATEGFVCSHAPAGFCSGLIQRSRYVVPLGPRPETTEEKLAQAKATATKLCEVAGRPQGADVTYECTGMETCVQTGIYVLTPLLAFLSSYCLPTC